MIILLIQLSTLPLNFAKSPLSPILFHLRARGLKPTRIGICAKHDLLQSATRVVKTSHIGKHALARWRERVRDRAGEGLLANSQKALLC